MRPAELVAMYGEELQSLAGLGPYPLWHLTEKLNYLTGAVGFLVEDDLDRHTQYIKTDIAVKRWAASDGQPFGGATTPAHRRRPRQR